jgi:hypothetical protein
MPAAVLSRAAMLESITASASELAMCDAGPERTYTRKAERDAVFPYIVWITTGEAGDFEGYYRQVGWAGTEDFNCWALTLDLAQQVYEAMVALFHHRRHPITGHLAIASAVSYVTDGEDPSGVGVFVRGRLRMRMVAV